MSVFSHATIQDMKYIYCKYNLNDYIPSGIF